MKIAMLAPEFLPVWGGVGTYVVELVRNFPKDVEVHVITPFRKRIGNRVVSSGDYDFEEMFGNNVHIHFLSTASDTFIYNAKFQIALFQALNKIINREDIDIVHSNAGHMPDLFIKPTKLGVPVVTTIHSTLTGQLGAIKQTGSKFFQLEFSEQMTLLLSPFLMWSENIYYTNNRYYITVSKWSKRRVTNEKRLEPHTVKVIYNGVDPVKFNPRRKKEAKEHFSELTDIGAPKVLYLSRLVEKKGVNILLRVIPKILKKLDAHFVFAGPGKDSYFKKYEIPEKHYTFLGYVDHELTPFLYALADIFVLPSFYENFPISILEAMASETAVVSTNVGGIPEMIASGYNGILIPPKDVDSLANALIQLIENDHLRKKIERNARKTILRKFTWRRTAKLTVEYYEEILSEVKK
ncbi:MAG: hypothetical protein DRP09_18020 [Candidatus Thorarchaeota archaeon]|nr:MAG: hypothetical protein DRP09_18020 [Candidatus Thorarchaeota archaeon]